MVPSGTATHTIKVTDGTNDISSPPSGAPTIASTASPQPNTVNFIFPSSGSVCIVLTSVASDEPLITIDLGFLGTARDWNLGANRGPDVYSAYVSSAGVVSLENLNWISSDCAVSDTSLYTCTFVSGTFSAAPNCLVSVISSNTTNDTVARISQDPTSTTVVVRTGTSSEATGFTKSANAFQIECQKSGVDFAKSGVGYTPDITAWKIDANISGANISLGTSAQTAYVTPNSASLTLTTNTSAGSAPVGISCSSTNDNSALASTCSVGSEEPGITAVFPRAGLVKACFDFSHHITTAASGVVNATFQVVRTANGSQTIAEEGKSREQSSLAISSSRVVVPFSLCGTLAIPSGDRHTIRLMYEQSVTATVTTSEIYADADTNNGQRDIHVTIQYIDQSVTAPNILNTLVTKYAGVYAVESAHISSADAVSEESGDWINGSCTNATTGKATCNFNSGIFSADPVCICAPDNGANTTCRISSSSSSSVTVDVISDTTLANGDFNLVCAGPR
jgi:hypothetical protein